MNFFTKFSKLLKKIIFYGSMDIFIFLFNVQTIFLYSLKLFYEFISLFFRNNSLFFPEFCHGQ